VIAETEVTGGGANVSGAGSHAASKKQTAKIRPNIFFIVKILLFAIIALMF
jgi:hypothetical protein